MTENGEAVLHLALWVVMIIILATLFIIFAPDPKECLVWEKKCKPIFKCNKYFGGETVCYPDIQCENVCTQYKVEK